MKKLTKETYGFLRLYSFQHPKSFIDKELESYGYDLDMVYFLNECGFKTLNDLYQNKTKLDALCLLKQDYLQNIHDDLFKKLKRLKNKERITLKILRNHKDEQDLLWPIARLVDITQPNNKVFEPRACDSKKDIHVKEFIKPKEIENKYDVTYKLGPNDSEITFKLTEKQKFLNNRLLAFYNFDAKKRFTLGQFNHAFKVKNETSYPLNNPNKDPVCKFSNGDTYKYKNKDELILAQLVHDTPFILNLKGTTQSIKLTLENKTTYTYVPTMVIRTFNEKVGFLSAMPTLKLVDYKTIQIWEALKKYCKENNYMCFFCSYDLSSYDTILETKISSCLNKDLNTVMKISGFYAYANLVEFHKKHKTLNLDKLLLEVAAYCYQKDYIFDLNHFGQYKFRISKKENIKI